MKEVTLKLDKDFRIDTVDQRIFGGFIELMGRCVYEGVYDPACSSSDENGFRMDVLEALGRLNMTAMRYPGGNFASGYNWQDGIGVKERRPVMRELAWQSIETNQFGTDEYMKICRKMDWTPMLTVNLGTGTPEQARNWVEYCNAPVGTKYADMRAANGEKDPYAVKLWCLGNEMDGPWQIGHVPAKDYAIRAQQAAKMMRDADGSIETAVCGSCGTELPTYMSWDEDVLEYCWDYIDYISLHNYARNDNDNTPEYLAYSQIIDKQIEDMAAACRFVQGKLKKKKPVKLCFDEWNVWYKNKQTDGKGKRAPHLIEEVYNLEDALVVAEFLNSFIRHSDVVKIANIAQVANVIAPILTDGDKMLLQSIYYVFEMFSKRRKGEAVRQMTSGDGYQTASGETVSFVDSSAIIDDSRLTVFAVNRAIDEDTNLNIDIAGCGISSIIDCDILTANNPKQANSFEKPDLITSKDGREKITLADKTATINMPPLSVTAATFEMEQ